MLATRQDDKYVQAIQKLIKQELPREELSRQDTARSEKPAAKAKPLGRKSDTEAKDAASSGGNGATPSGGGGEGRRRGLLGRNKRKNPDKKTTGQASGQVEAKPLPEKAQKAEASAKPEKTGRGPRKDTGNAKNQSSDAFDGNMPDFLKKQIKYVSKW